MLERDNYVVLDQFLPGDLANGLHRELLRAYKAGRLPETKHEMVGCPRLELGSLAGGKTGDSLTYQMDAVRGDYVAWFDGKEKACEWNVLPTYLQRIDTLVAELAEHVKELVNTASVRSNAMATCYPGNGAHYVRHCDNTTTIRNGRKITSLFYSNPDWVPGDGGELRIFNPQDALEEKDRVYTKIRDIEPLSNRVVLFFADERVPHEVLPTNSMRFAITTWYFDKVEKEAANSLKGRKNVEEEERIKREISKFQSKYGEEALIVAKGQDTKADDEKVKEATVCITETSNIWQLD